MIWIPRNQQERGGAMGEQKDDIRMVQAIAAKMENLAADLEALMPAVRDARRALSEDAPGAARVSGYKGSVDALDADAAEGYGFGRIERARHRILAALADPTDGMLRP
jgi:hypothetical protein